MKIEPISIEEIREAVSTGFAEDPEKWPVTVRSVMGLIMAWANERALGKELEHQDNCEQCINANHEQDGCGRSWWITVNWLNEVLDEIGWPKDQR